VSPPRKRDYCARPTIFEKRHVHTGGLDHDILRREAAGTIVLWEMNRPTIVDNSAVNTIPTRWQIVQVALASRDAAQAVPVRVACNVADCPSSPTRYDRARNASTASRAFSNASCSGANSS
jgi:hypothetical protein